MFITSTKMESNIQPIVDTLGWSSKIEQDIIVFPKGKEEDWSVMCEMIRSRLNKGSHYAVVGGVPAKIIKYRFAEEDIEKLLALKLYDLDEKQFLKMREKLQTDDVDSLINFQ